MTPAGTSNKLDANNKREENTHIYAPTSPEESGPCNWTCLRKKGAVPHCILHQVKNIISSRHGRGDSLLSLGVKSQSVEMFEAVMIVVVENLLEEEVSRCTLDQGTC